MPERLRSTFATTIFSKSICFFLIFIVVQPSVAVSISYVDVSTLNISSHGDQDVSGILRRYIQTGAIIRFPPGRYRFESTLVIPEDVSNVQIVGVRDETVFIKAINSPILRIKGDNNLISGVVLDGQCVKSANCGPDPKKGSNILINGSHNVLNNIASINSISNGVHFDGQMSRCEGNIVLSSVVQNNMRVGIASAGSRNLVIVNNVIRNNGYEGITADLSTTDIHIYENTIQDSNSLGGIGAIGFDHMNRAIIERNKFSCDKYCKKPFLRAGNATGASTDIFVVRNSFSGEVIAVDLRGTAKSIAGNRNFVIRQNKFDRVLPENRMKIDLDDRDISFEE